MKAPVISRPSPELTFSRKTRTVQLVTKTYHGSYLAECHPLRFLAIPSDKSNASPVGMLKTQEPKVWPLQQVLTDSHVLVMALMHSRHAYACIATLSDALSRRQQGVAKRDARSGLVFSRHKECHGRIPSCGGKFCCYFFIPLVFFLFHSSHIFPSHCSIRE